MQQGYSGDFYSEQFDCILEEGEDKHISQTDYFWTLSHFIVDTERDIDVNYLISKGQYRLGQQ